MENIITDKHIVSDVCDWKNAPLGTVVAECECCFCKGVTAKTDKTYVIQSWSKMELKRQQSIFEKKDGVAATIVPSDINPNVAVRALKRRMKDLGAGKGILFVHYGTIDQYVMRERILGSLCEAAFEIFSDDQFDVEEAAFLF